MIFVDAEIPTPAVDGVTVNFFLQNAPNPPSSLIVNSDTSLLAPNGVGFTLTGVNLVLVAPPKNCLVVWYRY